MPGLHAPQTLRLPARLDAAALGQIRLALLDLQGQAVRLEADGVERAGALALQLLLAARKTWRAHGAELSIVGPSPVLVDALERLGGSELLPSAPTGDGA